MKIYESIFNKLNLIAFILYLLALIGVFIVSNNTIEFINKLILSYVSLFLILKFNPLQKTKKKITNHERSVIFTGGILLLAFSFIPNSFLTALGTGLDIFFVEIIPAL
tara:strand:+ start:1214 stop:1537 length:324 start_codon:yes stop_codon:yes gene_type:complete